MVYEIPIIFGCVIIGVLAGMFFAWLSDKRLLKKIKRNLPDILDMIEEHKLKYTEVKNAREQRTREIKEREEGVRRSSRNTTNSSEETRDKRTSDEPSRKRLPVRGFTLRD